MLVTCAPRPGLRRLADVVIAVATGPEVLTGSTRLKAGSATKAVLNAMTTAAMVRLGKAYGNLMVDMQPGNAKLRDRARRIVTAATGLSAAEAARLLDEAGGEAKTAIVMGRLGLDARAARQRLRAAKGHVRRALARALRGWASLLGHSSETVSSHPRSSSTFHLTSFRSVFDTVNCECVSACLQARRRAHSTAINPRAFPNQSSG